LQANARNFDKVSGGSVGRGTGPAPEIRRSGESLVNVNTTRKWPCGYYPQWWVDRGVKIIPGTYESESIQVNGSASGRDNIGADLHQRDGVTGLGGADRDSQEGYARERS